MSIYDRQKIVCFSISFVRQIHAYSLISENENLTVCLGNIISVSDYFIIHNVWNIN
jgi:hypothetical protein